jgi:mannose-1-phosphate guanylyltransferase
MRTKARLTITLPPDLLDEVDQMVGQRNIRNRSHAIEVLLRGSLSPKAAAAVLLAGGPSKEDYLPALMPIQGQALIVLTVSQLVAHGIRNIIILAGQSEARLRGLLGDGTYLGAAVRYVSEPRPLGTAGALKSAEQYLVNGPFLVLHADILTNMNVSELVKFHTSQNGLATMAVKPRQAEPSYGKVLLEGSRITEFIGQSQAQGVSIVNAGVYMFEPEVLGLIEAGTRSRLETDIFPKLARLGELRAFLFQGVWFDISRSENYEAAQERWLQQGGFSHAE